MSHKKSTRFNWDEDHEMVFQETLFHMDTTIDSLLPLLSDIRTQEIVKNEKYDSIKVVRFSRKDSLHIVIMKTVQLISNLRAAKILIDNGFVYEFGVMCRLLQEVIEDILFLIYENRADKKSDMHEKFKNTFYTEDIDEEGKWQQPNNWLGRKKIRKFIEKCLREDSNKLGTQVDSLDETMKGLYDFGSGYVHGRVSKAMRLYDLEENKFLTNGLHDEKYLSIELKRFWVILIKAVACFGSIGQWQGAPEEYIFNINMLLKKLIKLKPNTASKK